MKVAERLKHRWLVRFAKDWQLSPGGTRAGGEAQQILIVAPRAIPTIDYYLGELIGAQSGSMRTRVVYDDELERWEGLGAVESMLPMTRVILVRMPSPRWARVMDSARRHIAEIVWLIDDDVLAALEDDWLPKDYRLRLLVDYLTFKRSFERLIDRIWASTPGVAARFPAERVQVRPPQPIATPPRAAWVTVFYHGTGAHRREHAFLLPILQEVQARSPRTVLELAGDHALYRMFRLVPRLRVVHPMRWPDYLSHLHAGQYDVGLAPLLDTPFNRARSAVKVLEIASIGAQAILSSRPPYTSCSHLPGMHLVDDNPSSWVERILAVTGALRAGA